MGQGGRVWVKRQWGIGSGEVERTGQIVALDVEQRDEADDADHTDECAKDERGCEAELLGIGGFQAENDRERKEEHGDDGNGACQSGREVESVRVDAFSPCEFGIPKEWDRITLKNDG